MIELVLFYFYGHCKEFGFHNGKFLSLPSEFANNTRTFISGSYLNSVSRFELSFIQFVMELNEQYSY